MKALVLAAFICCAASDSQQSPPLDAQQLHDRVLNTMLLGVKVTVNELVAEDFAEEYGLKVVPQLEDMMKQDMPAGVKGRVSFCLGKIGSPSSGLVLISFLDSQFPPRLSMEAYRDIEGAMYGLGFIGSPEGLDYLKKLSNPEYWRERFDREGTPVKLNRSGEDIGYSPTNLVNLLFVQRAIKALGLSENIMAEEILEEMVQTVPSEFTNEVIASIESCRNRRGGLRARERQAAKQEQQQEQEQEQERRSIR